MEPKKILRAALRVGNVIVNATSPLGIGLGMSQAILETSDDFKKERQICGVDLENRISELSRMIDIITSNYTTREELEKAKGEILELFQNNLRHNLTINEEQIIKNIDGSKRSIDSLLDFQREKFVTLLPHFFGGNAEKLFSSYAKILDLDERNYKRDAINIVSAYRGRPAIYQIDPLSFGLILKGFLIGRCFGDSEAEFALDTDSSLIFDGFDLAKNVVEEKPVDFLSGFKISDVKIRAPFDSRRLKVINKFDLPLSSRSAFILNSQNSLIICGDDMRTFYDALMGIELFRTSQNTISDFFTCPDRNMHKEYILSKDHKILYDLSTGNKAIVSPREINSSIVTVGGRLVHLEYSESRGAKRLCDVLTGNVIMQYPFSLHVSSLAQINSNSAIGRGWEKHRNVFFNLEDGEEYARFPKEMNCFIKYFGDAVFGEAHVRRESFLSCEPATLYELISGESFNLPYRVFSLHEVDGKKIALCGESGRLSPSGLISIIKTHYYELESRKCFWTTSVSCCNGTLARIEGYYLQISSRGIVDLESDKLIPWFPAHSFVVNSYEFKDGVFYVTATSLGSNKYSLYQLVLE